MSALPKTVYVIRRNARMIGFADNDKPYLIGFMQMTHAYLVKKNLVVNPVIRLERMESLGNQVSQFEQAMNIDMNVQLSVLKSDMTDLYNDGNMDVTVMDMDAFMTLPLLAKTGVVIPYELMEEDEEAYTFKCQIIAAQLD